ncbi:MAG: 2-oxoacid:acceptor oxidoreductase family protein, partial [Armatimonadetes bacterium]|nr:2-oxoacid:acceptor oxidoreductase family protein [Armatimonadota bacterium]
GQGVLFAGKILVYAGMLEGKEVSWLPSYGPEMRGGPVHCTVIVSSRRIGSPEVSLADSLIIMDAASMDLFGTRVKPGKLMVLNSSLVSGRPEADSLQVVEVPATESAEMLGDQRVANVIMLGAFLATRPIVSPDSVLEAMSLLAQKARTKPDLLELNQRALAKGAEFARDSS